MRQVFIRLRSTEQVQTFVRTLTALSGDFELISGKYILDARSLMGLFSLDLSSPIALRVYDDSAKNLEAIAPFIVAEEGEGHE